MLCIVEKNGNKLKFNWIELNWINNLIWIDLLFFSMVHHLTPDLSATFADQAAVICETARYMLELKKEQCQEFVNKVTAMAKHAGCQVSLLLNAAVIPSWKAFSSKPYRKASSRGAYGHDRFWSVFEEHPLDSTTTDITTALFIL